MLNISLYVVNGVHVIHIQGYYVSEKGFHQKLLATS